MKKVLVYLLLFALLGLIVVWCAGRYNGIVTLQENVENAWGQVQNQYQRRADLVPNLEAIVKGYAKHEKETYTAVQDARSKATQITIDPSHITPEQLSAFQQAQGELSQALGRLLAVAEAYPELHANENFLYLMDQLETTENRTASSREQFNAAAKTFNTYIRSFPNNVIAAIFGFERKPYFEAEPEAQKAPKVSF